MKIKNLAKAINNVPYGIDRPTKVLLIQNIGNELSSNGQRATLLKESGLMEYRWVQNLMSRKWVLEHKDTPHCCSVGSETYWSM